MTRTNLETKIVRWLAMSDDTWQRRTNPWSVWSRMTILPLLTVAIWSRVWLGRWFLAPVGAVLAWTWLNPLRNKNEISSRFCSNLQKKTSLIIS